MSSIGRVGQIVDISNHPHADNLELIQVWISLKTYVILVTGKHYRVGDLGIWISPGTVVSGFLAHDLWLVGKKRRNEPFEVRDIPIRGIDSPGLWIGSWYKNDKSKESSRKTDEYVGEVRDSQGFMKWPWWDSNWKVGDLITDLDKWQPSLRSSVTEQSVANRKDVGSIPAAGSNK